MSRKVEDSRKKKEASTRPEGEVILARFRGNLIGVLTQARCYLRKSIMKGTLALKIRQIVWAQRPRKPYAVRNDTYGKRTWTDEILLMRAIHRNGSIGIEWTKKGCYGQVKKSRVICRVEFRDDFFGSRDRLLN